MASTQLLAASVLAGIMFGMFAGVVGILARRTLRRWTPPAVAMILGMLTGGAVGAGVTSLIGGEMDREALIITTAAVGAFVPYMTTWRFFEINEESEAGAARSSSPESAGE